jgi:hypothetical protein
MTTKTRQQLRKYVQMLSDCAELHLRYSARAARTMSHDKLAFKAFLKF